MSSHQRQSAKPGSWVPTQVTWFSSAHPHKKFTRKGMRGGTCRFKKHISFVPCGPFHILIQCDWRCQEAEHWLIVYVRDSCLVSIVIWYCPYFLKSPYSLGKIYGWNVLWPVKGGGGSRWRRWKIYWPWAVNCKVRWWIDGESFYYLSSFEQFKIFYNKIFK